VEDQKNDAVFKVKKITKISDLKLDSSIPESDLTIQDDGHIYQFEHVEEGKKKKKIVLKPGINNLVPGPAGLEFSVIELGEYNLLESIDNTSKILSEANKFFSKVNTVYKQLNRQPKRSILLVSPPGVGKTSAINRVCKKFLSEDPGTAVVIWDTSAIRASNVNSLFQNSLAFHKKVTRLIFVIEDIGGGTVEDSYGPRGVDSSLLNLLDGVGNPFKDKPVFIIATTNNPEQSVAALIDRPGRFDKVIELATPNEKEAQELLAFIAKRELSEEEKQAAIKASKSKFSIAHLQEIVVRSLIDDCTFAEVVEQMIKHKDRVKNAFHDKNSMGLGF
jgi:Cdc6-like AAA superfamily ATPase